MFLFSDNLPKSVKDTIIYYAESCVRERLCQKTEIIKAEKLQNITRYNKYGHNISYTFHPDNSRIDVISLTLSLFLLKNHTSRVMI